MQVVIDCGDRGSRELLQAYLQCSQLMNSGRGTFEIAILCANETEEREFERIIKTEARSAMPIVWSLVAPRKGNAGGLESFAQFLACLAIAERPSRMHGYDCLSSLRESEGRLVRNKIAWFSLPSLDWIAGTLLKEHVWMGVPHGTENTSTAEDLLLKWNKTSPEPASDSRIASSTWVRSFIGGCLPALYRVVERNSIDRQTGIALLREIAAALSTERLGVKQLYSPLASNAIEELCIELKTLAASLEADMSKLRSVVENSPWLANWIADSKAVLGKQVEFLYSSSWSLLSLIPSSSFAPIGYASRATWAKAVAVTRERLSLSFVRWKRHMATKLTEEFGGAHRTLEFVPFDLSTNENEELWPLKENIAIVAQRESLFR